MTLSTMVSPCYKMEAETKWYKEMLYTDPTTEGLGDTSGTSGINDFWKGKYFFPKLGNRYLFPPIRLIFFS